MAHSKTVLRRSLFILFLRCSHASLLHITKLIKYVNWNSQNRFNHTCYFVIHNNWFSSVIAPWKHKFVFMDKKTNKQTNPFICILSERFYPVCDPLFLISDQLNDTVRSSRMLIKLPNRVKVLQSSWELQLNSKCKGSQRNYLYVEGEKKKRVQTTSDWRWKFIRCMKFLQCICSKSTGGKTKKEDEAKTTPLPF